MQTTSGASTPCHDAACRISTATDIPLRKRSNIVTGPIFPVPRAMHGVRHARTRPCTGRDRVSTGLSPRVRPSSETAARSGLRDIDV